MSLPNERKLKNLLECWPAGTVATSAWLESMGISKQLCFRYRKSGWLIPLGRGAFAKHGERVELNGAIYALQRQLQLPVHIGGSTALALQGQAHYIRMGPEKVHMFAFTNVILPHWFHTYDWGIPIEIHHTLFLPQNIGLISHGNNIFHTLISGPERAILECLYLAPRLVDIAECYQIMAGLATMRPQLLQQLLNQCNSIKVKRLFLYMAEKIGHAWYQHLDKSVINLGHGPRSIVKDGVYVKGYDIIVPKELEP